MVSSKNYSLIKMRFLSFGILIRNDGFGSSSFGGNSATTSGFGTSNNWGSGMDDFQMNSNRFGDLDEGYSIGISLSDSDDSDSDNDAEKKSPDDNNKEDEKNGDTKSTMEGNIVRKS